jgi:type II secretory pathway component GspD/PulD (secretin)
MTIKSEIREKVIQMAKEGKGRNEITATLNLSNIKIASGSVSNILKEWHDSERREQLESSNESDVRVTTSPEETLAEIKFKKNKDISIKNQIINTQDFEENGYLLTKVKVKKVARYPGLRMVPK